MRKISLILHNLRSAHNVGSIFRLADAAGVAKIFLTGYTPAPTDRFGRINKEIAKTALGAEKNIEWQKEEDIFWLIKKLKTENYQMVALEQATNSTDYRKIKLKNKTAVVLGNEVTGLESEILKQGALIAEIPMRGKKESLNVAVAAGIALFRWLE